MAVFTLDWSNADIDGDNRLDSSGDRVVVDVSTPRNRGESWSVENFGGGVVGLQARNVSDPTVVSLAFDEPVRNISFELFDVDASAGGWDDQITIIALDSAGNQVPVSFSDLAFHHQVSGNVLNTNDNVSPGVETVGAADSVTVNIAGPIVSLQVIYDNDGGPEDSGTVGLSDITFETFGPLDGYVEGTPGDDVIDIAYAGDPEEDRVDNGDAILPGAAPQDDVILAGDGDDTIVAGSGDDLVIGGDGGDTIDGGDGADIIYGDSPAFDGTLDFNALNAGDLVNAQFIENGVRISSMNPDNPTMIFDTANDDSEENSLETSTAGNALILSKDNDPTEPDVDNDGGTFLFEFTGPTTINSLDFIGRNRDTTIRFFDENGNQISQINVPDGDRNTVFTQTINVAGVSRMEVTLEGKAALDNLNYTIINPTDDNDDTIIGGDGADLIYAQSGSDTILGGTAGDVIFGGEDADGNDIDVLDLTGSDVDFITYEPGDPEAGTVTFLNGTTLTFSQIENVIPCFTPGTLIATPQGARLVENLTVGDRVQTRDNGIQTIVWAGRKAVSHANLIIAPELRPVRIDAGALGNGVPVRDMLVSPNHRILIVSELAELYFGQSEVLVAAKHLTHRDGIDIVDVPGVTYVHFMFNNHEVILADGAWSESFQPGDYTLRGVGEAQRAEIFALFPELATKQGVTDYRAARGSLKRHEAALLT
ncbi:Hint domain-containing protein [Yoonia sp.]|uniref:Hint domain-containing protein n=1 Tax=Yoonia sp. TaxID=2212373 RepID=UPI003F6AC1E1